LTVIHLITLVSSSEGERGEVGGVVVWGCEFNCHKMDFTKLFSTRERQFTYWNVCRCFLTQFMTVGSRVVNFFATLMAS